MEIKMKDWHIKLNGLSEVDFMCLFRMNILYTGNNNSFIFIDYFDKQIKIIFMISPYEESVYKYMTYKSILVSSLLSMIRLESLITRNMFEVTYEKP